MKKKESLIGSILGGGFLGRDRSLRLLPFMGYLTALALIAIKCAHSADEKVMRINDLRSEMKELEAEFMETKGQLEELNMESKVIQRAEKLGLQEAQTPPKKIVIETDE
jgi:cell division protein FtsL